MRNQRDVTLTLRHAYAAGLQTRYQIVEQPIAQVGGFLLVGSQEGIARQSLGHALCLRLGLFAGLALRVLTQQVVEVDRAVV